MKKYPKIMYFQFIFLLNSCNQSLKWSLLGVKKVGPYPNWSPLGVLFKISDEHPHHFHIGVPPDSIQVVCIELTKPCSNKCSRMWSRGPKSSPAVNCGL